MFSLDGRVAMVTGAGQGVGAVVAATLARQGAAVVVNDLFEDRARATAESIVADGGAAIAIAADVTDRAAVTAAVRTAESSLGPVDILVNNAGIPASGMNFVRFAESEPEDWRPFIDLNIYGVLLVTRLVVNGMLAREHGRIVTVVSDAGRVGEPYQTVYAASKAAAAGFSRSLAKEVGKHGVTANCLSLGSISNPAVAKDPERLARQLRYYPVRRLGTPADVASAVAWLASDEAGWVTGQTIPVNGGYSTS
ncbi:MAG TPA: SDR family oxidoreductase [Amycolatopsis sp.]|nr:SDR family oxidoreductase [Amycolatopsis sp.]